MRQRRQLRRRADHQEQRDHPAPSPRGESVAVADPQRTSASAERRQRDHGKYCRAKQHGRRRRSGDSRAQAVGSPPQPAQQSKPAEAGQQRAPGGGGRPPRLPCLRPGAHRSRHRSFERHPCSNLQEALPKIPWEPGLAIDPSALDSVVRCTRPAIVGRRARPTAPRPSMVARALWKTEGPAWAAVLAKAGVGRAPACAATGPCACTCAATGRTGGGRQKWGRRQTARRVMSARSAEGAGCTHATRYVLLRIHEAKTWTAWRASMFTPVLHRGSAQAVHGFCGTWI